MAQFSNNARLIGMWLADDLDGIPLKSNAEYLADIREQDRQREIALNDFPMQEANNETTKA